MKYIVLFTMALVTITLAVFGWFLLSPTGHTSDEVVFEVRPGSSFNRVANELHSKNLISNTLLLKIVAKATGHTTKVRMGEYRLNHGMRPLEVLKVLSTGKSLTYSFTFPEGVNLYEMASQIEKKGLGSKEEFMGLVQDRALIKELLNEDLPTLEGYLFPETYSYTKYDTLESIIEMMVARFLKVYSTVAHLKKPGFTRHQWVTLASIIEKETGFEDERKNISSVFHNRLKKNMRLQTDPTVLYGVLDKTKVMKKNITKRDLKTKNRYNTYTFKGLPYGPISNPGKKSLEAAMKPADTGYLYFVSRNDGTSYFSKSLREHNNAVRKYQLNSRARKGKSWRDLKQRKAQ